MIYEYKNIYKIYIIYIKYISDMLCNRFLIEIYGYLRFKITWIEIHR